MRKLHIVFALTMSVGCGNIDFGEKQIGPPRIVDRKDEVIKIDDSAEVEILNMPTTNAFKPGETIKLNFLVRATSGGRMPEAVNVYVEDGAVVKGSAIASIVKVHAKDKVELTADVRLPNQSKNYTLRVEELFTDIVMPSEDGREPEYRTLKKNAKKISIRILGKM